MTKLLETITGLTATQPTVSRESEIKAATKRYHELTYGPPSPQGPPAKDAPLSEPELKKGLEARAKEIAAKLGIELQPPHKEEILRRADGRVSVCGYTFTGTPSAKILIDAARETKTTLASPDELAELRRLGDRFEKLNAEMLEQVSDANIDRIWKADQAKRGTPEYRALERRDAAQLCRESLRVIKSELAEILAQAAPVLALVKERVRKSLHKRLQDVLLEEITRSLDQSVPFSPSVYANTLDLMLSQLDRAAEIGASNPVKTPFWRALAELVKA
ncbi:MAG: hypothetical protein HZA90_06140 [Verrucomicrobia bacterium]|nr:hypothetical protein [Verrucomicrobiota bacterium]